LGGIGIKESNITTAALFGLNLNPSVERRIGIRKFRPWSEMAVIFGSGNGPEGPLLEVFYESLW
jgi:hypothetical protein